MPIPLHANQARLTINGVVYELHDVSVRQDDSIEFDRVTYDGGRTFGRTRGRVSSRVVIEAEVMPEPRVVGYAPPYQQLSDRDLRDRILSATGGSAVAVATGEALDRLAAVYGVSREPVVVPPDTVKFLEATQAGLTTPRKPAPEPRSVWDRLLGEEALV